METKDILLFLANGKEEDVEKVRKQIQDELNDMYLSMVIENCTEYLDKVPCEKDVPSPEEWIDYIRQRVIKDTAEMSARLTGNMWH